MTPSTVKCFFVSDLHLFANRSDAHRHLHTIAGVASRAGVFVLGGDTFDFRWARIATRKAVDLAIRWLGDLTESAPACQFHLVLGNHDYYQPFIDRLVDRAPTMANLAWHRYYVRLGSSVFLHGDVADKEMDSRTLAEAREEWLDARRRGPWLSKLYDVVILTRLHKPMPYLVYSRRIVVRRILNYLQSIGQGPADGVRNVYFGHTHRQLSNYYYRGLRFHNGGAPIKGVKYRILQATL